MPQTFEERNEHHGEGAANDQQNDVEHVHWLLTKTTTPIGMVVSASMVRRNVDNTIRNAASQRR